MEKRLQTLIPTAQILEQQYHEERYRLQLYQKEIRNVEEQLMYGPTPCRIRTRDWARPVPHRHRDSAHVSPHLRRDVGTSGRARWRRRRSRTSLSGARRRRSSLSSRRACSWRRRSKPRSSTGMSRHGVRSTSVRSSRWIGVSANTRARTHADAFFDGCVQMIERLTASLEEKTLALSAAHDGYTQ